MMDGIRLIAITDTCLVSQEFLLQRAEVLCRDCRPGSVAIQLRDRQLAVRERLRLGGQLALVARRHQQAFSVNDRLDLALALDADGLHLGEASVAATDIRARVGNRFWLTRASHNPAECHALGADAVLLSPICSPRKGAPSLGLSCLTRACQSVQVPVYALGGIDAQSAAGCLTAGASGIAAIGAWLGGKSLTALINALGISRSNGA